MFDILKGNMDALSYIRRIFFSDRTAMRLLAVGFVINIIMFFAVAIKIAEGNKTIPLHFNVIYGIEFVGSNLLLLQIPILGLVVLILNGYLSKRIFKFDRVLALAVNFAAILVQLFLAIGLANIVWFNR
ncbi:MAG: hypothetical protein HY397_01800 [Candidatus Doudnabacteria bacterium]|nr:hypothetical protein [Candidatus Doudnabacteria bacterium]